MIKLNCEVHIIKNKQAQWMCRTCRALNLPHIFLNTAAGVTCQPSTMNEHTLHSNLFFDNYSFFAHSRSLDLWDYKTNNKIICNWTNFLDTSSKNGVYRCNNSFKMFFSFHIDLLSFVDDIMQQRIQVFPKTKKISNCLSSN